MISFFKSLKASAVYAAETFRFIPAALFCMVLITVMSSCKGRTMNNMVPNGDTVEVTPEVMSGPDANNNSDVNRIPDTETEVETPDSTSDFE